MLYKLNNGQLYRSNSFAASVKVVRGSDGVGDSEAERKGGREGRKEGGFVSLAKGMVRA